MCHVQVKILQNGGMFVTIHILQIRFRFLPFPYISLRMMIGTGTESFFISVFIYCSFIIHITINGNSHVFRI